MTDNPIALIRVPSKAVFGPRAAAQFLDIHPHTLRKLTDEGVIQAKWDPRMKRRSYLWIELQRYIDSLEDYNPGHGESPIPRKDN